MSTASVEQLYEDDFYAWTQAQAKELRQFARSRPNLPLDLAHLAEEIADLGKSERDSLRSWTRRIVEHLLLLEFSPAQEPRPGWITEVVNFRTEIEERLTGTLRRDLRRQLPRLYDRARKDLHQKLAAYGEFHIALRFPDRCPYTLDQVLGNHWPAAPDDGQPA